MNDNKRKRDDTLILMRVRKSGREINTGFRLLIEHILIIRRLLLLPATKVANDALTTNFRGAECKHLRTTYLDQGLESIR